MTHLPPTDTLEAKGEACGVKLVDETYISKCFANNSLPPSAQETLLSCLINILALLGASGKDIDLTAWLVDTMAACFEELYAHPLAISPKMPGIFSMTKSALSQAKTPEELHVLYDNLMGMKSNMLTGVEHWTAAVYHTQAQKILMKAVGQDWSGTQQKINFWLDKANRIRSGSSRGIII
eukprot:3035009-Ditylum_brightwellii.AAC.2